MTSRPKRKAPTLAVRVAALERALCEIWGCDKIEYDHFPCLWERKVNRSGTDYIPPQNDPAYITPKPAGEHAVKTNGTKATSAGSDTHRRAHGKRLAEKNAEFTSAMQSKQRGRKKSGPRRPKRKIPSRPLKGRQFEKRQSNEKR